MRKPNPSKRTNSQHEDQVFCSTSKGFCPFAQGAFVALSHEAQDEIRNGAKWLDVRSPAEYQIAHLPDAISLPLHELRTRAAELEKDRLYICCCENGRLSSSAVFLLAQRGIKCAVLRGGIQRLSL